LQYGVEHSQCGDHVAMLRFHAIQGGIELSVDFHCTDPDEIKRRKHSTTVGPFKITPL
jgi:hypothetical protein